MGSDSGLWARCWDGDLWHNLDLTESVVRSVLSYLSQYQTITTDRLHVAILGTLLGKQVNLYSNNYYKNKSVYDLSLKKYQNIKYIDLPKDIKPPRSFISLKIRKTIKEFFNK